MNKNTTFLDTPSISLRGSLFNFQQPRIMSIFNLSPDSFYDGGRLNSVEITLLKAEKDVEQGADIIDLGAYSTRPGASFVSISEEWSRLKPHLVSIRQKFPEIPISIDTFRSEIVRLALEEGADLVNDISGGNLDHKMFETIAEKKVPYILMHSKGNPATMKNLANYKSLMVDILDDLQNKLFQLRELNVRDILIDPGFGFAKTISQNFTLLKNLEDFKIFNLPILVGLSNKSMIYRSLKIEVKDALNGTSVAHTLALLGGANILRVHDVKAASEVREIWKLYEKAD